MAIAITTGSENSFETNENDMNTLAPKRVAKSRKLVK